MPTPLVVKNGLNILFRFSSGIPVPLSVTDIFTRSLFVQVVTVPAHLADAGYTVEIPPPSEAAAGVSGYELQSITIKVKKDGNVKLTMTFYRVGLAL